jgi:hypothetical protein
MPQPPSAMPDPLSQEPNSAQPSPCSNGAQLRALVLASGLTQETALALFCTAVPPLATPYALSTWKAFMAEAGSKRARPFSCDLLARAHRIFAPLALSNSGEPSVARSSEPAAAHSWERATKLLDLRTQLAQVTHSREALDQAEARLRQEVASLLGVWPGVTLEAGELLLEVVQATGEFQESSKEVATAYACIRCVVTPVTKSGASQSRKSSHIIVDGQPLPTNLT